MHYRFLVTFDADTAKTSEDARQHVFDTLDDEGFCSSGRWGGGLADWFVIGGRWSGELSRHSWARALMAQMDALEQEKGVQVCGAHYGDKAKQKLQRTLTRQFQKLWDAAAPPDYKGIPIQRSTSIDIGEEDDAMLLTQDFYNALLKEYEGETDNAQHADLNDDAVSPTLIGKKWIVVVDYHN
ncbi:MAG: hypothetical protein AAB539_03755 [Patescibacteria group bacterium]